MSNPNEPSTPKNLSVARSTLDFPVVGIGASAGGLKALMSLFEQMPSDSGMAFVVIMHLSPTHESNADSILQNKTRMPVIQVTQPVPIERNRIYVIPPALDLSMNDGYLRLTKPTRERGVQVAIDLFFRALADVHHTHAIGIVLSGAGSDGSVGLSRIKEQGGVTMAQSPDDAEYDSMPRSAIETGMVDIVLPVLEMPQRLLELSRNMQTMEPPIESPAASEQASSRTPSQVNESALHNILGLLRSRTGHDFRHYKQATVLRRIERRLQVNAVHDMAGYAQLLNDRPEETPALLADMLIGVTNFFRDQEAFDALERDIIPRLFEEKALLGESDALRIWSAACSTGEEAYSLGMLFTEYVERNGLRADVQVFATDIDDQALEIARASLYPEAIVTDVPANRLQQYFTKEQNRYRMRKELRERILFARHNILRDPPFSRLDLISCRNLLIYLDRDIQSEVLRMFHFALNPGGYLFLGNSETADICSHLFAPVDKKNRIYRARDIGNQRRAPMPSLQNFSTASPTRVSGVAMARRSKLSFAYAHQRALEQYAPPSVIVNHESEIVHMSDRAGRFLRYVSGEPSLNLTTLVQPELRLALRSALYQAIQTGKSIETRRISLEREGRRFYIDMTVCPFRDDDAGADYLLVLFDETEDLSDRLPETSQGDASDSELTQLQVELQQTKEQLQLTIEHSEASTEELRASNEELQAINEELRSASEDLETSKEELQSINEELITVNAELKSKVDETSKINDDLQNLISSTDIATLFVDRHMRIKWFTPRAQDIFNVIGSDAGRSLLDITHRLDYPTLYSDASEAFGELQLVEREVRSHEDKWYMARFLPYRTTDDRIQGAVLTFIDITDRRNAEERVRAGEAHMKLLAQSMRGYAIITTDLQGKMTAWNRGAESIFGYSEQEAIGQCIDLIYTAADREVGVPEGERKRALEQGQATDERWHLRKDGSQFFCSGLVNPLVDSAGNMMGFAKIGRDLTEQQRINSLRASELESIQAASLQKDEFFAVLSHELKHPLNLIQLNTDLIARSQVVKNATSLSKATQSIQSAVRSQSRIIDDLMDVSRIRTGKLKLHFITLHYQDLLRGIESVFLPLVEGEGVTFDSVQPEEALYIHADPTRLEQIIWNLLNNAWKFTKGGDCISLQLERDGDLARLDVIDTGMGISEEFLPKVFDMFGQAEMQHAQRSKHGLGIGLALVKQLVEAHNGRIEAFSEGIGRGARFSVWLPVHLQTELALSELTAAGEAGGLAGIKILLVDDSPDILDTMRELLESEGANVTTADGGAQGIELAEVTRFDMIISDVGMPGIDGHKMMNEIRHGDTNATTPSIALTGYGTLRDVEKAKAAGFTQHLRKPIDLQALIDAVTQAVR